MGRNLRILTALLALALLGFSAWGYPQLPERIPIHFDTRFQPDGWGSRSTFLLMPFVGIASALVLHIVARFAAAKPGAINMPGKEKLLALPAAEQQWALEPVRVMLDAMATLMLLLFILIQASIWQAAHGRPISGLATTGLVAAIALMLALPLWLVVQLQRRVDAAHRRAKLGMPPAP